MAEKVTVGTGPCACPLLVGLGRDLHSINQQKIIIFCFLFSVYLLFSTSCFADTAKQIRVAIGQDVESLSLKVNGTYAISDANLKVLSSGKNLRTTVTAYKNGILIGGNSFNTDKILISTNNQDVIIINGRMFRGDIQFIKTSPVKFSVVNHIDLEEYINGILYHEVSHYWPMEALKAQAIASRTYAVYHMRQNKLKTFDLTNDTSQVYGGRNSERYRTNKAVEETKGKVLIYQDKIIPAYFSTTCGGHTEDSFLLWDIQMAPLKGVPCPFCKDSPHFNWHCVLSLKEINDKLEGAGYKIDNIKEIISLGNDSSGRVTNLNIITAKGDFKIPAKDFRSIIGSNIIRSTNFKVNVIEQDAVFEGLGWGHGVGMCQWGAYFMAKQGYNYEDILKFYYPGSEITMFETKYQTDVEK
ncbi:MAG: SpoIID/LytB domain-containing protein [Candidatus Omnitrophota bacterium]